MTSPARQPDSAASGARRSALVKDQAADLPLPGIKLVDADRPVALALSFREQLRRGMQSLSGAWELPLLEWPPRDGLLNFCAQSNQTFANMGSRPPDLSRTLGLATPMAARLESGQSTI